MTQLWPAVVIGALLVSCDEQPGTVTPMANVQPAITGNAEVRKHISRARTHVKQSQEASQAEGKELDQVAKDLDALLQEFWIRRE